MSSSRHALFTPRFFVMCGFTFTVFLSAFQLFPTAPFRIQALGGSTFAAGLFLGLLTYASALSAPITGALADQIGRRRVLLVASLASVVFSAAYGITTSYRVTLALTIPHGIFWSGLLSASGAYLTSILPDDRRAEGLGYWGLSTVAAIAVAPTLGFWLFSYGWGWLCVATAALNLVMAGIAWSLDDDPGAASAGAKLGVASLEWQVLALSFSLFLVTFGYGGITSFTAMYADANGVAPKGLYLSVVALAILVTRPFTPRLADRVGHRRVFLPSLGMLSCGLALLAFRATAPWMVLSATIFGAGFGAAYPVFAAHVMQGVSAARRGAAFGAILAAFDIGIGTGSISIGWLIQRFGFGTAFGVAAGLSVLALPYFIVVDRRLAAHRSKSMVAPPSDSVLPKQTNA